MRLSASRIRSINRAIARVQSSAWSAPNRNTHRTLANPTLVVSENRGQTGRSPCFPTAAAPPPTEHSPPTRAYPYLGAQT